MPPRPIPENPLQRKYVPAIIDTKNKNAAACECANIRKPAQVLRPPTQRPQVGRTAWILYDDSAPHARGGFAVFSPCLCRIKSVRSLRRVGLLPARRFCFSPTARGPVRPGAGAVKHPHGRRAHSEQAWKEGA